MGIEHVVAGRWVRLDTPDWGGLEALLPIALCGPFMWMGAVLLDDGETLGAYKHHATRRYLHLDPSGATYGYRGDAGCCRIRHHDAIEHVFNPSWLLHRASEEERAGLKIALSTAAKRDRQESERGLSLPPCRA